MKKILYIIIPLLILALMEGIAWMVLKKSSEKGSPPLAVIEEQLSRREPSIEPTAPPEIPKTEEVLKEDTPAAKDLEPLPYSGMGNTDSESFPPTTTEVKNGKTERTIHMGVRQYVWEPAAITARKGELVRLVIHNADVLHGLVIPDLGVDQNIPPDGAIVEFMANKVGTFEFFCSVWCGEGHIEMRGKITIE